MIISNKIEINENKFTTLYDNHTNYSTENTYSFDNKLKPINKEAHFKNNENLKSSKKIIDVYERNLKNNPRDATMLYLLGKAYLELKEYDKAILPLNSAIEIDPNLFEAWYYLGLMYWNLRDFEKIQDILLHIEDLTKRNRYQELLCSHCQQTFKTEEALKQHINAKHLEKTKVKPKKRKKEKSCCSNCGRKFKTEEALKHHINAKHLERTTEKSIKKKKKKIKYSECQCKFKTEEPLKQHFNEKYQPKKTFEQKKIICTICIKRFKTQEALKQHNDSKHHQKNLDSLIKIEKNDKNVNSIEKIKKIIEQTYNNNCDQKLSSKNESKNDITALNRKSITKKCKNNKVICDVHGFEFEEASEEIFNVLEKCLRNNIRTIDVIHGYIHGNVFKNYFRSGDFIKEAERVNIKLKMKNNADRGITTFELI